MENFFSLALDLALRSNLDLKLLGDETLIACMRASPKGPFFQAASLFVK